MFEVESPSCQLLGLHYHRGLPLIEIIQRQAFYITQIEGRTEESDYGVNSACCDQDLIKVERPERNRKFASGES